MNIAHYISSGSPIPRVVFSSTFSLNLSFPFPWGVHVTPVSGFPEIDGPHSKVSKDLPPSSCCISVENIRWLRRRY